MKKLFLLLLAFLFPFSAFAEETQNTPIEWCIDNLATNYDIEATVHVQSMCEYPDIPILQPAIQPVILTPTKEKQKPQNIIGYFEASKVNHWATTWTISLNLNLTGAILNINKIQTWNKFTPVSAVTEDKKIIITLKQFDDKRLDVECTNYELTIPKNALTTSNWDKNDEGITGNFIVENCPQNRTPPTDWDDPIYQTGSTQKYKNTLKSENTYLSLYDTDEDGKIYFNLTNIIYFLGFSAFFLVVFFLLFAFIKNSFIWKSQR